MLYFKVAKEVREEYTDTMSKILFSYFKSYIGRISKLEFEASARRDDLLGAEEAGSKVNNNLIIKVIELKERKSFLGISTIRFLLHFPYS